MASLIPLGTLSGGGGPGPVESTDIIDSSPLGRSILSAADAAAVLVAIGAGTSNLTLGTTSTTAKAGNWKPVPADIDGSSAVGRTLVAAADAAAARTAIGAGTSSLTLGATSTTAKAGDWKPTAADVSDATTLGRDLMKTPSASAARTALQVPASSEVEDIAAAAAESAVPGELGSSAVVDPASTVAGLVTGRRAREAAVAALVAFGQPYTVYYNGTVWPALSTVPAAYIATGRPIIWDSMTYPAAPAPPEGRTGDFWDSVEEDV